MSDDDTTLPSETRQALLEAIQRAAPNANSRGANALESLARAYALVMKGSDDLSGPSVH